MPNEAPNANQRSVTAASISARKGHAKECGMLLLRVVEKEEEKKKKEDGRVFNWKNSRLNEFLLKGEKNKIWNPCVCVCVSFDTSLAGCVYYNPPVCVWNPILFHFREDILRDSRIKLPLP